MPTIRNRQPQTQNTYDDYTESIVDVISFSNIFGCRFLIVGMVLRRKEKNLQCKTMPTIRNRQPQTQNTYDDYTESIVHVISFSNISSMPLTIRNRQPQTQNIRRLHRVNRRCDFFVIFFFFKFLF